MRVGFTSTVAALSAAFSIALSGAGAQPLTDDPKLAAKLRAAEHWLATTLEHEATPGASVAIVYDQEIVWASGFGYANLETRTPATPDTRYSVCSISKLFTSISAMQLRDAGQLDLDQPIDAYLDWFEIGDIESAEEPVTIRNILSHVSGLPREADLPYWGEVNFPDMETIRSTVRTQSKLYRPYDYFQYSNLGMTLLGDAISQISERAYDEYVQTEILDPLAMTHTATDHPLALRGGEFSIGYMARNGHGERNAFDGYKMNGIAPAAGFVSTVNDLAKFASWQFRLHENGGEEIIKATTLREMQRVHWIEPEFDGPAWGFGFATRRFKGKTFWGHGGYCPGYRSEFLTRPKEKIAYIVLLNVNDVSPRSIAYSLYDMTAADIAAAAKKRKAKKRERTARPKHDFSVYEGVYANAGYDWDTYFGFDGETLFSIDLYTDDPADNLTRYEHVEGGVFRRKRDDDTLAEEIRFEIGEDGRASRYWQHSNYLTRKD